MAHAAEISDTHVEHTGHGGHHVISKQVLFRTFGALVALTVLTVGLGYAERYDLVHFGSLSVPIALAIAGVKAFLVAAYFMGLKYDGGTNLLAFVGSILFLIIFLAFTFLDTLFRDTFEPSSAVPVDVINAQAMEAEARSERLQPMFEAQPLVEQPDPIVGGAAAPAGDAMSAPVDGDATATPTPADLPDGESSSATPVAQ